MKLTFLTSAYIYFLLFVKIESAIEVNAYDSYSEELQHAMNEIEGLNTSTAYSYLFDVRLHTNYDTSLIKDLVELIAKSQLVSKESCKARRLLVMETISNSFEGTGSIIKSIILTIAQAMHSNRTVIWGLDMSKSFQLSRELWSSSSANELFIGDRKFDCITDADSHGGPFGCFFQRVSTCTLEDVSKAELIDFANNAYNDSARVRYYDPSRTSIALYKPPKGLFEHLSVTHKQKELLSSSKSTWGHVWSAAVAAYVFRLKPDVVDIFIQRNPDVIRSDVVMWSAHVRHGDIAALPEVYSDRFTIFAFEDYFTAIKQMAVTRGRVPSHIYIATDSDRAPEVPEMYQEFLSSSSDVSDGEELWLGESSPPQLLIADNSRRYRTPHGSHTVAADGGCVPTANSTAETPGKLFFNLPGSFRHNLHVPQNNCITI